MIVFACLNIHAPGVVCSPPGRPPCLILNPTPGQDGANRKTKARGTIMARADVTAA